MLNHVNYTEMTSGVGPVRVEIQFEVGVFRARFIIRNSNHSLLTSLTLCHCLEMANVTIKIIA